MLYVCQVRARSALGLPPPFIAFAQASLTGTVRDPSGAVLPGVIVEAASPVLIEKVRTTATDGNGRYQIIDLRPGDYTVTFSLAGSAPSRREGVTLSGSSATTSTPSCGWVRSRRP